MDKETFLSDLIEIKDWSKEYINNPKNSGKVHELGALLKRLNDELDKVLKERSNIL